MKHGHFLAKTTVDNTCISFVLWLEPCLISSNTDKMTALCYTLLGQSAYVDDLSLTSHHTLSFPIFPTRAIMTPWIQEFEALQATSLSCLAVMMSSMWRVTGCHVALWRRSVADLATCLTVCLPACLPVCLLT